MTPAQLYTLKKHRSLFDAAYSNLLDVERPPFVNDMTFAQEVHQFRTVILQVPRLTGKTTFLAEKFWEEICKGNSPFFVGKNHSLTQDALRNFIHILPPTDRAHIGNFENIKSSKYSWLRRGVPIEYLTGRVVLFLDEVELDMYAFDKLFSGFYQTFSTNEPPLIFGLRT